MIKHLIKLTLVENLLFNKIFVRLRNKRGTSKFKS